MTCYVADTDTGRTFFCGDLGDHCHECGDVAALLCDYPVGNNRTCDRPLCERHAREIAPEIDYCVPHLAEWQQFKDAGGVRRELENVVPFTDRRP